MTKILKCASAYFDSENPVEYATFIVEWTDGPARYHVWVNGDGKIEDVLHKNAVAKPRIAADPAQPYDRYKNSKPNPEYFEHRGLDLTAKKHTETRAEIVAMITPEALAIAVDIAREEEQAKEAERIRIARTVRKAHLTEQADKLLTDGRIRAANIVRAIVLLDDETFDVTFGAIWKAVTAQI